MLISTNPGLKFHPIFVQMPFLDNFFIFLLEHPIFKLETKRVIIKLFFKAIRSEIGIRNNPGLSLPIFEQPCFENNLKNAPYKNSWQ